MIFLLMFFKKLPENRESSGGLRKEGGLGD